VKCGSLRRILYGLIASVLLSAIVTANTRPAPQFTMQTLDGESFSNASLRGRVILVQFWATWCQYCRSDQPAVDNLERSFADKGLIVLAVDVDEPEETVRQYLRTTPRSCRVVLDHGANLATRFGAQGFPYYVLIDGNGNIAGTQSGSLGEASLRLLLGRAGLSQSSNTRVAGNQLPAIPSGGASPKLIEVPAGQSTLASRPAPKTIFVFADGSRLEADHYTLDDAFLQVMVDGQEHKIALSTLDIKATVAINHQRGIDLNIPKSRNQIFLSF
jgi:thiol-disulfide isomerase/thioredoxin